MDDIRVLATSLSSPNERKLAANNIITNYDLHFTTDDIIKAFTNLLNRNMHSEVIFATYLTLTTNLRMFIAIMYASIDDTIVKSWCYFLVQRRSNFEHVGKDYKSIIEWIDEGYELGHECPITGMEWIAQIYNTLYDHYEFDITNLVLSDRLRELIQQHIDSKITYTKRLLKNEVMK